jgi:hypothetical protein
MVNGRLLFVGVFLLGLSAYATAQPATTWHSDRVSNDYINKRIDALAEQYKQYAPIPKTGVFDIGYPKNAGEYATLDGYGLFLLAAVSHTRNELPVKRLYVSVDGKEIDLFQLKSYFTESKDSSTQTFKTFGAYRQDAIYAFPVYLRYKTADVYLQWSTDRKPMRVASFDGTTSPFLKTLPGTPPKGKTYPAKALDSYMKREYPGYFEN